MNLIDWSPVVSLHNEFDWRESCKVVSLHHEDAFEKNLVVSIFLSQTAWSEVL